MDNKVFDITEARCNHEEKNQRSVASVERMNDKYNRLSVEEIKWLWSNLKDYYKKYSKKLVNTANTQGFCPKSGRRIFRIHLQDLALQ